jgi:hypothetical protein
LERAKLYDLDVDGRFKVKVNFSLNVRSTSYGEDEVQLHIFSFFAYVGGEGGRGRRPANAPVTLRPNKKSPLPTEKETVWALSN